MSEALTGETSVKEILNDELEATVKAGDSVCELSFANHMSNVFSNAFKELCGDVEDVVDEEEIGDLPPGFEENLRRIFPPCSSKFRPSRLVECNPKITEYVASALCRQKLHDEVLEEWKSSFLDSAFNQVFMSIKKHFQSDGHEVRISFILIYKNLNMFMPTVCLSYYLQELKYVLVNCLCYLVLFSLIVVPQLIYLYFVFVFLQKGKIFNASKEHLTDATSGLGRTKDRAKSSSGVPLVIGKYTYHRKKLSRKELCTSQSVSVDDSGSGKQPVSKLRKHVSGDLDETAKVKIAAVKRGKTRLIKGKKDKSTKSRSSPVNVNGSLDSDQSLLKNKTSLKALKLSHTVQSM